VVVLVLDKVKEMVVYMVEFGVCGGIIGAEEGRG